MLGNGASKLYLGKVSESYLGLFTAVLLKPGTLICKFCGQCIRALDITSPESGDLSFFTDLTEETAVDGSLFGTLA